MPKPVFVEMTETGGIKHYVNIYWIEDMHVVDSGTKTFTAIVFAINGGSLAVKETPEEILSMVHDKLNNKEGGE